MKKLVLLLVAVLLISVVWTEWDGSQYREITPEEAKYNLASDKSILLLDVRTKEEYNSGHIVGATLFSLDRIRLEFEAAYPDKDQMIYVYCQSGRRSKTAAKTLVKLGYNQVFDLSGIDRWPYDIE